MWLIASIPSPKMHNVYNSRSLLKTIIHILSQIVCVTMYNYITTFTSSQMISLLLKLYYFIDIEMFIKMHCFFLFVVCTQHDSALTVAVVCYILLVRQKTEAMINQADGKCRSCEVGLLCHTVMDVYTNTSLPWWSKEY